jgi:hypothetical protein
MGSKGLKDFWLGLSSADYGGNDLAERAAVDHCPPAHLLMNRL